VFSKWSSGVRTFLGKTISTGVFDFVSRLLGGVANQQGSQYTAPRICEALLVEMQARCDSGEMFLPTSHVTASSSTSHSTVLFITAQSSQQPGPSRAHSSTQAGTSQTRKRQSPGDRGPGGKRRREGKGLPVHHSTSPPYPATSSATTQSPSMPTHSTSSPQPDDSDMELSSLQSPLL